MTKIDFTKITTGKPSDQITEPEKLFPLLPKPDETEYNYLRDVQGEVLSQWFERRAEFDLVVKMNTGSGKTVVALMILKSSLNEKLGPAAYFAPDIYLANQVRKEAAHLGIDTCSEPNDPDFLQGRSILVDNIASLVNGKSVFGIDEIKVPLGSVIIDDAHACLEKVESQFSLVIERNEHQKVYKSILSIFKHSLIEQSEIGYEEIESEDARRIMLVPYWSWREHFEQVLSILHNWEGKCQFIWPLVKDRLRLGRCLVSGSKISVSLPCVPISIIRSFARAKRRIYLSATLTYDSILVSAFNVPSGAIQKPIVPKQIGDVGERLIIIPQSLNPNIGDEDLRQELSAISKGTTVIVVVPSERRAGLWSAFADGILRAENIYEGVQALRERQSGLYILVNKYDGVDLPHDACRVLVLDDLPTARSMLGRYEDMLLDGSEELMARRIQKIEQGMGRGIRANNDYCVVVPMGPRLIDFLNDPRATQKFTPATRKQFELSNEVAKQARGLELSELRGLMDLCLERNSEWKDASRNALAGLEEYPVESELETAVHRRKAFEESEIGQHNAAAQEMQNAVNSENRDQEQGILMQELASYTDFFDPVEAQKIQQKSVRHNASLLRPLSGITYHRLAPARKAQAESAQAYYQESYRNSNDMVIRFRSLIEDLVFIPESDSEPFERAMREIAFVLGYQGQRPEKEFGSGPDNLWAVGEMNYFVIECKSGTKTETVCKRDCDQLNGSVVWFQNKYDASCKMTPVIVHPSEVFDNDCSFMDGTRVINRDCLQKLKKAIDTLGSSWGQLGKLPSFEETRDLFDNMKLTPSLFLDNYTVAGSKKKKR
ncbi:MAG: DEAD/DEAH box helicase [Verrucomicrobiota bacterium]